MAKVFGLHAIELKPGVDEQAFETFFTEEIAPLYQRVPGQMCYLLKGDEGEREGRYLVMIEIESPERRNQLYPRKGDTWGLSEELEQHRPETQATWDKLGEFVVEYPDPHNTDYVVVGK
jgi:hypothetical protein